MLMGVPTTCAKSIGTCESRIAARRAAIRPRSVGRVWLAVDILRMERTGVVRWLQMRDEGEAEGATARTLRPKKSETFPHVVCPVPSAARSRAKEATSFSHLQQWQQNFERLSYIGSTIARKKLWLSSQIQVLDYLVQDVIGIGLTLVAHL